MGGVSADSRIGNNSNSDANIRNFSTLVNALWFDHSVCASFHKSHTSRCPKPSTRTSNPMFTTGYSACAKPNATRSRLKMPAPTAKENASSIKKESKATCIRRNIYLPKIKAASATTPGNVKSNTRSNNDNGEVKSHG